MQVMKRLPLAIEVRPMGSAYALGAEGLGFEGLSSKDLKSLECNSVVESRIPIWLLRDPIVPSNSTPRP